MKRDVCNPPLLTGAQTGVNLGAFTSELQEGSLAFVNYVSLK